jgi:hypothetical protein
MARDWVGLVRLLQGFHFVFGQVDVQRFDGLAFFVPGVSLKAHKST